MIYSQRTLYRMHGSSSVIIYQDFHSLIISLLRNYKENVIRHSNVVYLEQPSKPLGQTFLV